MKFFSKLTLLALALFLQTDQQALAMRLNQSNSIHLTEDGDDAAAPEDAPAADAAAPEDAPADKKAPAAEKVGEEKAAPKETKGATKENPDKKEEPKKGSKKEAEKDAAEEAEQLPDPLTISNVGSSAGQSHVVDAMNEGPCEERLNITEYEMIKQMEYFSRRFEIEYFNNAMTIWKNLTKEGRMDRPLLVHTWELYDKAFSFPRVRRYTFVQENLDMLEHFEDNLNTNVSNQMNLANFLRVANTVRHNLNQKYGKDGGFNDPALDDPYEVKVEDWSNVKLPDPIY